MYIRCVIYMRKQLLVELHIHYILSKLWLFLFSYTIKATRLFETWLQQISNGNKTKSVAADDIGTLLHGFQSRPSQTVLGGVWMALGSIRMVPDGF